MTDQTKDNIVRFCSVFVSMAIMFFVGYSVGHQAGTDTCWPTPPFRNQQQVHEKGTQ